MQLRDSTHIETNQQHLDVGTYWLYDPMVTLAQGFLPPYDSALEEVAAAIVALDLDGSSWAAVVRHTYDMIYNGQETGRYRWDQLMKTEKTHFGTLFEINAQREFKFEGYDRDKTDYRIAGHLVDAKWSQTEGEWMLPPEITGELALVATGDDARSTWSLGLVRIYPEFRRESLNRDKKSRLNDDGRQAVRWLWKKAQMPQNILLHLKPDEVAHIFAHRHGTKRTDRLFRVAEGRLVHRNTVATVSRQLDAQKRVRYNGGSRSTLKPEGYIILSGKYYAHLADQLRVPVPGPLEYVSVRVVPSQGDEGAYIDGQRWRRARHDEPTVVAAPHLPDRGVRE